MKERIADPPGLQRDVRVDHEPPCRSSVDRALYFNLEVKIQLHLPGRKP